MPLAQGAGGEHLKILSDLLWTSRSDGCSVAFYSPSEIKEPASRYRLLSGDRHIAKLVRKIPGHPALELDRLNVVPYDENGGFSGDPASARRSGAGPTGRWGPAAACRAILISPL